MGAARQMGPLGLVRGRCRQFAEEKAQLKPTFTLSFMPTDTLIQIGKRASLWGILLILLIALAVYIATLIVPSKRKKK